MSPRFILRSSLVAVATAAMVAPVSALAEPVGVRPAAPASAPASVSAFVTVDDSTTDALTAAAKGLLSARAGELVVDQTPMTVNSRVAGVSLSARTAQTETAVRSRVKANRAWLKKGSEGYTKATVSLDRVKASRTGSTITLRATEVTFLDYAKIRGDEPPNTGYTADHEFVYRLDSAGAWTLDEDRQLEPTGLLPLREAVQFVHGDTSMPTNTEPALAGVGGTPASTNRDARPTSAADTAAKTTSTSLLAGYSYSAMAAYLEKYWSSYNTAYRSFAGQGQGGDCTNFASQALKAGGWAQLSGFYRDPSYWWYNSANQTFSWTSVNHLATFGFERGRFSSLSNVWSLGLGDVLQIDGGRDGSKDHTMMVSYKTSSSPYFTYHSSNRYRRSMQTVLNDWGAANYYAQRT